MEDEQFKQLLIGALRNDIRLCFSTPDQGLKVHTNDGGPAADTLPVVTFAYTLDEDATAEEAAPLFSANILSRAGMGVCGVAVASASFVNSNQCTARVVILPDHATHLQLNQTS
jgi:hypothetical protein